MRPESLPAGVALTNRQLQVLRLIAQGCSNKEIARHLGLTERTVKFHVAGIFERLGVSSRTQALARAFSLGLVQPSL
jgi:LuxR family maltose regulon positive regulatory protein